MDNVNLCDACGVASGLFSVVRVRGERVSGWVACVMRTFSCSLGVTEALGLKVFIVPVTRVPESTAASVA